MKACSSRVAGRRFRPERLCRLQRHPGRLLRLRRPVRGRRAARRQRNRAQRGEDVRYDLEISLEDALRGMSGRDSGAAHGGVLELQRFRRRAARRAHRLPDVPRPRRSHLPAELPFHPPHLLAMQRPGPDRPPALPAVPRRGLSAGGPQAQDQHPAGRGHRNPAAPYRRRAARPPRRSGRATSTLCWPSKSTRSSTATGTTCLHGPVNVAQAALGTQVDILTFEGLQQVKIPEGTQSGAQVRVRGQGMPALNGGGKRRPGGQRRCARAVQAHPGTAEASRTVARHPSGGERAQRKGPLRQGQRLLHVSSRDESGI